MFSNMTRRDFMKGILAGGVAACSAGLLTACGSASAGSTSSSTSASSTSSGSSSTTSSESTGSDDVIDLTFWYAYTGTIQEYIDAAVERFNTTVGAEKGISVTAEYQGAYTDLHQKLQAAYIAGTAPDVTELEIGVVGEFSNGGMVQSLDSFIEADNYDLSDFYDGLLYNCNINDSYYALPFLRSTSIMYMNATLLAEAGVDADEVHTWDDVTAACEAVYETTGKYGMTMYSYYWFYEAFLLTLGSFPINEDETEITIDTDECRQMIAYIEDLYEKKWLHFYANSESDKCSADVTNQDAAIWFGSTGSLSSYLAIAQEQGFEMTCAFIPKGTSYGVAVGGCNMAMLSGLSAERQQAVWEFIKFMATEEETVEANIVTGYLATRKSAQENADMQALYAEYPQYKVATEQLEYSHGRPNASGYAEWQLDFHDAVSEIIINGADLDTTLAELEEEGNELLNE